MASPSLAEVSQSEPRLKKELGLWDLVLAQILCVVGSTWVGVAAKLGKAHVVFWVVAILMYYVPLAAVVIFLNRSMPLEGGLYRWAKIGFGDFAGFLTAWNLWVYAMICVGSILFSLPTDLAYLLPSHASWLPGSRIGTVSLVWAATLAIALVALRGLGVGKWLHNAGSALIVLAYAILLLLPVWAIATGRLHSFTAFPLQAPKISFLSLAIFGQMTVGGLSGFEYLAILAGECRSASRTVGQSVVISAPAIAVMFIVGTSTVLAFVGPDSVNLIGPLPQTFRAALGSTPVGSIVAPFAIFLILGRAVASASLIFTGLTRLPMIAGWDHLLPAWFTALHPRWKTPVNATCFVTALIMVVTLLSTAGVHEQEALQLLQNASTVHYGITYVVLFAIPLWGVGTLRRALPRWLGALSFAGLISSIVAVLIAVHPIINVSSHTSYAVKIGGTVLLTNAAAVIFYLGRSRGFGRVHRQT